MNKTAWVTAVVLAFALGAGFASYAGKKKAGVTIDAWSETSAEGAAAALLAISAELAEDGSWQNIHVARVHYMAGHTEKAEAIFDRYVGGSKPDPGDLVRIARVYAHSGDWEKAKPLYEQLLSLAPKDEDWMVEAGAFYNLNGDRERAEELFAKAFSISPRSLKNALSAAGSYIDVPPRKR